MHHRFFFFLSILMIRSQLKSPPIRAHKREHTPTTDRPTNHSLWRRFAAVVGAISSHSIFLHSHLFAVPYIIVYEYRSNTLRLSCTRVYFSNSVIQYDSLYFCDPVGCCSFAARSRFNDIIINSLYLLISRPDYRPSTCPPCTCSRYSITIA